MGIKQIMAASMVEAIYSKDVGRYAPFTERAITALTESGHIKNQIPTRDNQRRERVDALGYDFWYTGFEQLPDETFMDLYDKWMWRHTQQR